jgi:hypothetical protein
LPTAVTSDLPYRLPDEQQPCSRATSVPLGAVR